MIAAIALCLSIQVAAPDLDEFDIHSLIAHPGLESGDFDQVREDWLRELEARPDSRVARSVLEDVSRVASENLEDRIAWLAAKSAVRATLKYQLTQGLTEAHGDVGWVIGSILTSVTERADLRSWQTLPDSWHGARMFAPPGQHQLVLTALGGERIALGTYELERGETLFVIARTVQSRVHAEVLGGRLVE